MTRSVLAAVAVFLAAVAPSSAGEIRARTGSRPRLLHRRPQVRHRPRRQRARLAAAAGGGRRSGCRPRPRRRRQGRLSVRAQGLRGAVDGRAGGRPGQRSPRRLRRGRPGLPRACDTDSRHLGARSGRPARPAAEQHLHLQPDRAGRPRLHRRHGRPRQPPAVHRPDGERLHGGERRQRHERLQRPRHARRGHDGWHDLRRGQAGHAARRAGAQLLGLGLERGRDRRRRLGHAEPRQARSREHEPRGRRLHRARPGGCQLDQRRSQLRDRRGQLQRERVQLVAGPRPQRRHGRMPRRTPTLAPRSRTSGRVSTSSRRARASRRPGAPATRRPTRSAGRRWRHRTWRVRLPSTCRRTRPHRRRRRRQR